MEKSFFLGVLPGQMAWVELLYSTLSVSDSEMRSENDKKKSKLVLGVSIKPSIANF